MFAGRFPAFKTIWTRLSRERVSSVELANNQTVSHSSAGPGGRRPQHRLTGRTVVVLLQVDFTATTHRRPHVNVSLHGGDPLLSMFSFAFWIDSRYPPLSQPLSDQRQTRHTSNTQLSQGLCCFYIRHQPRSTRADYLQD